MARNTSTSFAAERRTRDPILVVENLKKHFPITEGVLKREVGRVRAVDGVSFEIPRGRTVGLVGESGCGKSTVALNVLRIQQPTEGRIRFDGEDVTEYDGAELKRFRRRAQMIFQDPDTSFDPRMTIGESVAEPLIVHGLKDRERRREIVENLLERVGLQRSDIDRYPHEISGGQKQRVALARAIVLNPELVVADEPVAALDVSIQAEILTLLADIQEQFGLSLLIISHNLRVIRQICDWVAVMYLGKFVETGPTEEIFESPAHPYTQALVDSIPSTNPRERGQAKPLTGSVPSPANPPIGCSFHPRCPKIIPPDNFSIPSDIWRNIMDFRIRLESGDLAAELLADPSEDPKRSKARVRREFGFETGVQDARAKSILDEAIDTLIDGHPEKAIDILDRMETICRVEPKLEEYTTDCFASCHLANPPNESNYG